MSYKPLLDEAIELSAHKPERCVAAAARAGARAPWSRAATWTGPRPWPAPSPHACVPVAATDPLYILYTSGTTGMPKGVVRDNGGHAVAMNWSMKNVYDIEPGEVFWAASDVGWVVGHSYIVYAPLLYGCTTVLYEGKPVGTPDAGAFWRVISEHNVSVMFTAPTAFRAIKREDPNGEFLKKYDLSHFRALFLAGERCDPDTLHWAQDMLKVPVIDHWWQTETGWAIAANCLGIEAAAGQARLADQGRARLRRAGPGRRGQRAGARRDRPHHDQAAAAPRLPADPVAERRPLCRLLPERTSPATT